MGKWDRAAHMRPRLSARRAARQSFPCRAPGGFQSDCRLQHKVPNKLLFDWPVGLALHKSTVAVRKRPQLPADYARPAAQTIHERIAQVKTLLAYRST